MDPSKVFAKIKELGHVHSKRDELREYCALKIDQVGSTNTEHIRFQFLTLLTKYVHISVLFILDNKVFAAAYFK